VLEFLVFDLDETIYPRDSGLMQAISARISAYMVERMEMDPEIVPTLRRAYWEQYGTTSRGLQTLHGLDVEDYMQYVHDIPVHDYVRPDLALDRALNALSQRKVIFTNATEAHARGVLEAIGVARHFCGIYDVFYAGHESKPAPGAYRRLVQDLDTTGDRCLMVEDSARNLQPAKALGMVTVLVNPLPETELDGIDHVVARVSDIAEVVRLVEAGGK